jgi:hypothetical protein
MPFFRASNQIPSVIAASAVAVPLTGTLTETVLATVTIPAGAMGPNGFIRVNALFSNNNSATVKTPRIRFGGIGGTEYFNVAQTTNIGINTFRSITNRNSQSSQVGISSATNAFSATASSPITSAINTAASTTLVITGQLANILDTLTLESYSVELLYRS